MAWIKNNWLLLLAAVVLGLIGVWLFESVTGSLLGSLAGVETIRRKKRATQVSAREADKRQDYHTEKGSKHADKAEEPQKEAQEIAQEKDEPIKKRPGFVKKVFRSK